jgi:prolipoprotein diacylglyceryltransferase
VHRPPGYEQYATFQPTFLYEIIWNLLLAGVLIWLDNRRKVRPPGLFALYIAGYSAFRIFEETLRIDYSVHILGMRLNFWIALIGTLAGLLWFFRIQRRPESGGAANPGSDGRASAAEPAQSTAAYSGSGSE